MWSGYSILMTMSMHWKWLGNQCISLLKWPGYLQEVGIQLGSHRTSKQGLSSSRRTKEQAAFWWCYSNSLEKLWIHQWKFYHLEIHKNNYIRINKYWVRISRQSEGLAQGPYMAARAGFEPKTLWTKGIESTNEPSRSTSFSLFSVLLPSHRWHSKAVHISVYIRDSLQWLIQFKTISLSLGGSDLPEIFLHSGVF